VLDVLDAASETSNDLQRITKASFFWDHKLDSELLSFSR
jgi:hypothetical protein